MKPSLFWKIFVAFLVVIISLSSVSLIAFSRTLSSYHVEMLTEHLKGLATSLAVETRTMVEEKRYHQLQNVVGEAARDLGTRITVIDGQGRVLADSEQEAASMENHRNRPEVAAALRGETGTATRYSSTMDRDALYVAVPLVKGAGTEAVVRASVYIKDIHLPPHLWRQLFLVAALLTLLSLLVALFISRSLSRPVRQLTEAAARTASGDFTTRLFLKQSDELKPLADSFNSMNDEMSRMFSKVTRQKEEVTAIIESLREPLFVLDKEGRVVYVNQSLKRLAGVDGNVEGKFYWETMTQPSFIEMIEKARALKRGLTEEVNIDERVFLFSVTMVGEGREMVALLHDITDIKKIEKVKKDFVVNVSHELRTPLTSIKGFAETLEEEVEGEQRRYVEIIKRNTDRLINIVNDLLLLSKLEEEAHLQLEDIDLKVLVENTALIFEQQVTQKMLTLSIESEPALPHVQGDAYRLEQMLVNLIANAVKYTEKGTIHIRLYREKERVRIEIADTGIGIPPEDLSRIFERFYVVDKSRSRKLGGTGLGLAIVKHIVLLHGGDMEVKSAPEKGTTFVVSLPLNAA